jgi:hypothetical protein
MQIEIGNLFGLILIFSPADIFDDSPGLAMAMLFFPSTTDQTSGTDVLGSRPGGGKHQSLQKERYI